MKRFKSALWALALTAGVGAAVFTSTPASSAKLVNPNWQSVDENGTIIPTSMGGSYQANRTLAEAQADFGCAESSVTCAVTVTGQNGTKTPSPVYIFRD